MYDFEDLSVVLGICLISVVALLVGSCDFPTSAPSFKTETGLSTPVVVNKTFAFLGGPESQYEPLIDTTTAQFDSLFAVSSTDQSLSIEETVSDLDVGSLDQVFEEASQGFGVSASLSEAVVPGTDLATQTVNASIRRRNGVPPPTPTNTVTVPVARDTIPFPPGVLAFPDFEMASIQADTVRQATLTEETSVEGTLVNQLTVTLFNDPSNPVPLTDGEGNPPSINIRDEQGTTVASAEFGSTINQNETGTVVLDVEGETLGDDSELVLVVEGNDPEDELTVDLSPLRYEKITLSGVDQVQIEATETEVSIQESVGGAQFAGIESRGGTLQLDVTNDLGFPVQIDSLLLENHLEGAALPDSFQALNVYRSSGALDPGETKTFVVDLEDRGIAQGVDARLKGSLPQARDTVTARADGSLKVSASGSLRVGAMFFWPAGEQVQAGGAMDVQGDRIRFDRAADFVEFQGGTLALEHIVSEPEVAFESFSVSFPDLRRAPYGPGDSLTVSFPIGVEENPGVEHVELGDLRLSPTNNVIDYHLTGTLETITPSNRSTQTLRVLRFEDEVRADVSVQEVDVQALEAVVNPFSVNVTEDADGDGRLEVSDTTEAIQESFEGLEGLADNVRNLQLTGSHLNFQVTTDAGSEAELYAALQGRGGTSRTFLAGKGDKRVLPGAPLGDDFYAGGSPIAREDLIRMSVEGAPTDDPVTRSITLTDDNSAVDPFLSALPSSLRFVAQPRLTADDENRIRLRRPLEFDAGLSVSIPVQVTGDFNVEDTLDADFSGLDDITDPKKVVQISSAELRLEYVNGIPLGASARLHVLDDSGTELMTLPGNDQSLHLKAASTTDAGTTDGSQRGTTVLSLTDQQLRTLAEGRRLRVSLTMDSGEAAESVTLRPTDTIQLSLEAEVDASVTVD